MTATTAAVVDGLTSAAPDAHGQPRPLAGLGRQLRFVARRDRVRAVVWIAGVVGVVGLSALTVLSLYSTPEELASYAQVAQADAAFRAIAGPGYGLDAPTEGAVVMNETSLYTYLTVALMAVFMVVRHTRAEEDAGRAELVRAAPVGRATLLAAASIWVSAVSMAIGAGLTLALVGCGLPLAGSVAFGAATAATGITFTGITAIAAQLASTGRAANSFGGLVVGVAFLLRAIGDVGNGRLTWLSPLGIAQAIRPFADERWWVLALLAAIAAVAFTTAFALLARRDLGAGFVQQRPGPSTGAAHLASPLALAVRLQRPSVIGWIVGMVVFGFSFGLVIDQAEEFATNDAVADMIAQAGSGTLTEQFLAVTVLMMALMTSGFAVAAVLRLRAEEVGGRATPVLATPVGRVRWWSSHTTVSLVGGFVILVLTGLAIGLGEGAAGDFDVWSPLAASVTMFPAVALTAAVAALLVAALPRWAMLSWGLVTIATVVGLLGNTLDLPQWARNLSPFEHVPALPAADFEVFPIVALVALTAAALAVGAVAVRRRDVD